MLVGRGGDVEKGFHDAAVVYRRLDRGESSSTSCQVTWIRPRADAVTPFTVCRIRAALEIWSSALWQSPRMSSDRSSSVLWRGSTWTRLVASPPRPRRSLPGVSTHALAHAAQPGETDVGGQLGSPAERRPEAAHLLFTAGEEQRGDRSTGRYGFRGLGLSDITETTL